MATSNPIELLHSEEGLEGQPSATADEDDSQIQVGDIKGVMIDVDGPSTPNNPATPDAPKALPHGASFSDSWSGNGKIATPPPEAQSDKVGFTQSSPSNAGADGDSEAETLIESPEKRKSNPVEHAPKLPPADSSWRESGGENEVISSQSSESRSRKRKLSDDESKDESHRASSLRSSPLSSPTFDARSGTESGTLLSQRDQLRAELLDSSKGDAAHNDSKEASRKQHLGKASELKLKKRRKSEVEGSQPRSSRRRHSPDMGVSELREMRSATYPGQATTEPSLSPRPGRDHRRVTTGQSVQTLASYKTRRVPAPLNTKRHHSLDRSSEASNSPLPARPLLHKFTTNESDATSPAKVMAKKLRDRHGRTLLAQACTDDKLDRVKQVYEERPQDLNIADNAGNTPLQIAALQGHVDVVEYLLNKNVEVNTRNIEKDTPLIDAVENGHVEVVKLLLDHGADSRLGNATGQKPIELVDKDDVKIRKLLLDVKYKPVHRRQSEDQAPVTHPKEGSSRAASAASTRDSPPVHGPKSPPALQVSRRRAREQTRNDLLWQANTPENLTKLAGKGDSEGVVNILNILNKASPEALIAACKGGHDEVLQLLIAMGNPDPDPEPVIAHDQSGGYSTPMLAAIGEGNIQSIKLLVQQDGFDPTREFRGQTYYEISRERKGDNWEQESAVLEHAYEDYAKAHPERSSRKHANMEPHRDRSSSSPFSRRSKSPSRSYAESEATRDGKVNDTKRSELRGPHDADRAIVASSDHDGRTPRSEKRVHKAGRSRGDASYYNWDEDFRKRRRLISRKEHMKSNTNATEEKSEEEEAAPVRREDEKVPVKRRRSSIAAEIAQVLDLSRVKKRTRRALSDSSPEDSRAMKKRISSEDNLQQSLAATEIFKDVDTIFPKSQRDQIQRTFSLKSIAGDTGIDRVGAPQEMKRALKEDEKRMQVDRVRKIQEDNEAAERLAMEKDAERVKAEEAAKQEAEEQRMLAERKLAEEAAAKKKAEEERIATECRLLEEAAARKKVEEERIASARRLAEEAVAKEKADDEALARKKEEDDRQERARREIEEKQRRAEERRQRILREHEQRRMEALPQLLCKSAKLLDQNSPEAKSPEFLRKFLPLFTVKTRQVEPYCSSDVADEDWFPGFQAAPLLAAKNLGLEHFTHWEKRKVSDRERLCLWKVARTMLVQGAEHTSGLNMSIEEALQLDRDAHPKFEAMQPLVWVKLSDFRERLPLHPYLLGLPLRTQRIGLQPPKTAQPVFPSPNHSGGVSSSSNRSSSSIVRMSEVNVNGIIPNGTPGTNGYGHHH